MIKEKMVSIKPKAGLKVRKPDSMMLLRDEGETVPMVAYWARRLKDGDVEEVKKEEPKKSIPSSSRRKSKTQEEGEL